MCIVVGPSGDRIKVVKQQGNSTLLETIKELKGLRFTKHQYLEYINFFCLDSNKIDELKSIYDIFTPSLSSNTITTPIDIDSTSMSEPQVDIESEEEEEDVDIL